tara:strand:+ start:8589 stop:8930 length:342 start_codon:yes stop_codon:yes gene_type:complete
MQDLNEDKLEEFEINFDHLRDPELRESFLASFGYMVKSLLKGMFGNRVPQTRVIGTKSEVEAFAKALGSERNYLATLQNYGLDNPRAVKNKAVLRKNVSSFERKTGLKWPFKV